MYFTLSLNQNLGVFQLGVTKFEIVDTQFKTRFKGVGVIKVFLHKMITAKIKDHVDMTMFIIGL